MSEDDIEKLRELDEKTLSELFKEAKNSYTIPDKVNVNN